MPICRWRHRHRGRSILRVEAAVPRIREVTTRALIQHERRERTGAEVEFRTEIPEGGIVLANVGARIGASVGRGIDALPAEEHILDELGIGIMAQSLVIDAWFHPGADRQSGHAQPPAVDVRHWRLDQDVETAPVIPGDEEHARRPELVVNCMMVLNACPVT